MKTVNLCSCSDTDLDILALLNKQLIEDEKHDNEMSTEQLKERMWQFLNTGYRAYLFKSIGKIVGYALIDMTKEPIYLRQFFICRESRRAGYGTIAFLKLLETLSIETVDIEVLSWNQRAIAFWKSLGFYERSVYMRRRNTNV